MTPEDRLLDRITNPHQLRRLEEGDLKRLAQELRELIVEVVSKRGGHLASNLGIAELTIALHYVFDFSADRLLWDVGHQCYAHKILTGRAEQFNSLRQADGLSGFPAPSESPYDLFATGHAGTAISTAAGLALADQACGRDSRTVAVVGDGSIVNGLSLEGLNNSSLLKRQFLIILNDNSMAIDRTHGAMAGVLDRIRTSNTYGDIRQSTEQLLQRLPLGEEINEALRSLKAGLKTTLHGGKVFEALGFEYFGPVDGHDIHSLIGILRRLARLNRPALLHVHTQKGRGCQYAVEDPCRFHSPSAYTVQGGKAIFPTRPRPTWTAVFGKALVEAGKRNEKVVAITAAMPDGTGLDKFRAAFPERHFDVGISEGHALAMAAGLARGGLRPVVAIYSTFMQRAMDQVFQELSLQNLPVVLCMDRAGLVGSDGAVHHGFLDVAFLRSLPNMVLMAPADAAEMSAAMDFALTLECPSAIRYPRDEVAGDLAEDCPPFVLGKASLVRPGNDATILAYGTMTEVALEAADALQRDDGLAVAVVNARFAKPLDAGLITGLIASGKPLIVVEDHAIIGGFGSSVLELASAARLDASHVRLMGLPDRFIAHATRQEQLAEVGLDAAHVAAVVKECVAAPAD
ncbi:MAG: 1-deoxy-D-xylulose-5-phosphate synthase [Phycisphaerae bacterium]|jgi:1-deoxy-D-xylulose-5-phosphate synthase